LVRILERPLPEYEVPTDTHYTLEVMAFWRQDMLDAVKAGYRRTLVVGGLHRFFRTDLRVELPDALGRFTIARMSGQRARITIPQSAIALLKTPEGTLTSNFPRIAGGARFPASTYQMGFKERLAYRLDELTFAIQFVRLVGTPRRRWDWLIPQRFLIPQKFQ